MSLTSPYLEHRVYVMERTSQRSFYSFLFNGYQISFCMEIRVLANKMWLDMSFMSLLESEKPLAGQTLMR
jgi:hypothetical protein